MSVDPGWGKFLDQDVAIALTDGSMFVGHVVAIAANGITCQSGDGSTRTTPLETITSIELRPRPAAGAPEKTPAAAESTDHPDRAPDIEPQRGAPRVRLTLTRDAPIALYEVTAQMEASGTGAFSGAASGMTFRSVCAAPCDQIVDGRSGRPFFLGGERIPKSKRFTLLQYDGDVELEVRPGRHGLWFGGIVMMTTGVLPLGLSVLPLLKTEGGKPSPNVGVGAALIGVGVAMLVTGIVMYVRGSTKFTLKQRRLGRRHHAMGLRWG